ncbi:MAG: ABC transporter ATP-binding protein [Oscillospiraceae bacterium]|nr:ABC transporter ATP-binding protein [Oscillospiraceae bacterium]
MKRSGLKVMSRLIGLVKPLTGYMVLAVLMGLAGHLCAAFITIFGVFGVLSVFGAATPVSVNTVFVSILVFAAARAGLRYAEQACNHFIAFKLLALIRDKVFRALRRLCPAKLDDRGKGDLISVITSDIELLEVFYAHTISPFAIAVLFTVIMCLFIGSYHFSLGIIAIAAYLSVGVIIPAVASKKSGDQGMIFRKNSGELSSFVLDSLRGLPEIIQYTRGSKRLEEMGKMTDVLTQTEKKMKRNAGKNAACTNSVILLFDLLMLISATLLYRSGHVDFVGVLIPTVALFSSFGPCVALAALGSTLQNTFAAGNRVLDILDDTPVVTKTTGMPKTEFNGAQAQNVSFSYASELILDNICVDVSRGSVVGITGRSGCGKSTLLKLFMRFRDVNDGSIKISGTDISQVNTSDLREMESFVTQETQLFHDSIKNNLRIAKLDATEEDIIEACKKASVHDFILSLPKGYDTMVGELGDTLSGGERQRLGLARAFLHDAPLMLLDEPTSNLDSLNEAVILRSLYKEKQDKTVILVSHRPSTMKIAKRVYQICNGRMS